VKNLVTVEPLKDRLAGATKADPQTSKGTLVNFAWWMKKQGYADSTITGRTQLLTTLVNRGADLADPETIKAIIAQ
jgi:hypothetical protein